MNSFTQGNLDEGHRKPAQPHADIRVPLHLTAFADVDNVRIVRNELRRWLDLDVAPAQACDLLLAADEAMANSVEHAYSHSDYPGVLKVSAHRRREYVFVTVSDHGSWSDTPSSAYRGRGLALMRSLLDEVRVERASTGTTVAMISRISTSERDSSPGDSSIPST